MKKCIIIFLSIPSLLFAQNKHNEVIVIKSDKQIEEFISSLGQNELRLDFLVFPALSVGFEKNK
jgi:hypothetical protein